MVVTVVAMVRQGLIAAGIGAALVTAAAVSVLSADPQSAVPLAVDDPPTAPAPAPAPPPAQEPESPTTPQAPPAIAGEVITHGPRDVPEVAITLDTAFSAETARLTDAGVFPPQFNEPVLDYLTEAEVPATIFVTGLWAEAYPQAMARIADTEFFELGNHTWSHAGWTPNCFGLPAPGSEVDQRFEIARTSALISDYTGAWPTFLRFPALCHDQNAVALAGEYGMTTVDTDILMFDTGATNAAATSATIAAAAQPGSIILLHLTGAPNAPATLEILSQLLPALNQRGLTPVTLTELLN